MPLVKLTLMSGAEWPVTLSDMLLALGMLMLLFEVIKGARPGAKYLTDHLLSLIVFGGAAAEFVLWPQFGTSTFFLLTLLALVDFLSGIALRTRRGLLLRVQLRRGLQQARPRAPSRRAEPAARAGAARQRRLQAAPVAEPLHQSAESRDVPIIAHPRRSAAGRRRQRCRRRALQPGNGSPRARTGAALIMASPDQMDLLVTRGCAAARCGAGAGVARRHRRSARRAGVARRRLRVCGACSAVAINWADKVGIGPGGCWLAGSSSIGGLTSAPARRRRRPGVRMTPHLPSAPVDRRRTS